MNWIRCRSCATWYDGNRFTYCSVCGTASPTASEPPAVQPAPYVAPARPTAAPEVEVEAAQDGKVSAVPVVIIVGLLIWGLIALANSVPGPRYFPSAGFVTIIIVIVPAAMVLRGLNTSSDEPEVPKPAGSCTYTGLGCTSGCGIVVMVMFAVWFCVCVAVIR